MMKIETTQLRILVWIYREGSFSGAAKRLKITQSAISQSVKNIEKTIGLKLFNRVGIQTLPTQEGLKLINYGLRHLKELDNLVNSIINSKNEVHGDVTIGTFFGFGKSWLSSLCITLAKKYPQLNLTINMSLLTPLVQGFNNNEINMLVLPEEAITFPYDKKELIGNESLVLVYPKEARFDIYDDITIDKLEILPTIVFEKENDGLFNKWCKHVYKKYPQKINKRFAVNSHGNILHAVSEGLGIAVVPKHVLDRSFYKSQVNILNNLSVNSGKIFLVYKNEDSKLMRNNIVIEAIKEHYKNV